MMGSLLLCSLLSAVTFTAKHLGEPLQASGGLPIGHLGPALRPALMLKTSTRPTCPLARSTMPRRLVALGSLHPKAHPTLHPPS